MLTLLTTLKMSLFLATLDLAEIRTDFQKASSDKRLREAFYSKISEEPSHSPTIAAYKGSAKAMMAEVVLSPYSKYSLFKSGTEMIDLAAKQDPSNAEIRYLRFLIQTESPAFLGYDDDIENDFNIITKAIENCQKKESWMTHFQSFVKNNLKSVPNG